MHLTIRVAWHDNRWDCTVVAPLRTTHSALRSTAYARGEMAPQRGKLPNNIGTS